MDRQDNAEIEVTPAMIDAGVGYLTRFNDEFSPVTEGVQEIVAAVLEAGKFRVRYS